MSNWKPIRKSKSVRKRGVAARVIRKVEDIVFSEPSDVVGYSLRDAQNRRVYTGITNNPRARKAEHQIDGKKYSTFQIETEPMTRKEAEQWERRSLEGYRQRTGKLPLYNKTSTGQFQQRGYRHRPMGRRSRGRF